MTPNGKIGKSREKSGKVGKKRRDKSAELAEFCHIQSLIVSIGTNRMAHKNSGKRDKTGQNGTFVPFSTQLFMWETGQNGTHTLRCVPFVPCTTHFVLVPDCPADKLRESRFAHAEENP